MTPSASHCRHCYGGGIWVFNEQFADLGDLFNVGDLNERLADLATILIPAR